MLLRRTIAGAAIAVLVMLLATACGGDDDTSSPDAASVSPGTSATADATDSYRGGTVEPPFEKPDVVLTDTSGEPFDLRKETDGAITLLYVGYTHCPDICPMHMLDIADTLDSLPAEQADKVKVVFITADPERDTPEAIRKWLDNFDTEFIGLTGSEEAIASVHDQLSLPQPKKTDLGDGDYAVSHSAFVFAYTTDDKAHLVIPSGFTLEDWVHDINKLTTEGWNEG
jgi:protein SCO1/2